MTVSLRDAAVARLDLVGEPREALGRHVRVHQHPPGLDELARRVGLDDLAVDDDVRDARRTARISVARRARGTRRPGAGRTRRGRRSRSGSVHSGLVIASQIACGVALM